MKKVGIGLLILQALAIFGGISGGNSVFDQGINGGADLARMIGYFLPAIIGVILIVKAGKKSDTDTVGADGPKTNNSQKTAESSREGAGTQTAGFFCTKCGRPVKPEDNFCVYCGNAVKKH